MDLEKIIHSELFTGASGWITQVFIVVFFSLLVDFFLKRLLNRVRRKFELTKNLWDDAFINALRTPLSLLIWVIGIAFAAQIVEKNTQAAIFAAVAPVRDVSVIAIIAWFLVRFVGEVERNVLRKEVHGETPIDPTTANALSKLLRVSILITASLVALQTMGYSISGVLAFGGIGGIAIGFAAKDVLANFFGGLMIYLDRPFAVGEWIRSPDRDIEGTVEDIGWRLTRIRTFDKRPLYIPNATFATIAVQNPSRMSHRRINETIGIRYDDAAKMAAIVADVKSMLSNHPDIDQDQLLMVNFNSFGPSSLDFFIYTFTRTTDWAEYHRVKEKVLLAIYDIIEAHGAEVAFPTSTIHVPDQVLIKTLDGSELPVKPSAP
jgi:MscS family membrane protein